jgi:hypothetical protein
MSDTSDTAPANAGEKQSRGRFRKGESGNPAGKRPGTRNRATVLLEAIADDDLKAIVMKIVEKAKAGDLVAARLILDRIAPASRARALEIDLPTIGKQNVGDALIATYARITQAVSGGSITPAEALELMAIVDAHRAAIKELRPGQLDSPFTLGQSEADELITY